MDGVDCSSSRMSREFLNMRRQLRQDRMAYETALCRIWLCEAELSAPDMTPLLYSSDYEISQCASQQLVHLGSRLDSAVACLRGGTASESSHSFWGDFELPTAPKVEALSDELKKLRDRLAYRHTDREDGPAVKTEASRLPTELEDMSVVRCDQSAESVETAGVASQYETDTLDSGKPAEITPLIG